MGELAACCQIANSSSRRLPPPLARRLLVEIDSDEALRSESADQLSANASDAAVLFLRRPESWEGDLTSLAETADDTKGAQAVAKLQKQMAGLERELKATKAKLREALRRADDAEKSAADRVSAARADVRSAGRAATRRAEEATEKLATLEAERAKAERRTKELEAELGALKGRRDRKSQLATESTRPQGTDLTSRARQLDDLVVQAQQHHKSAFGDAAEVPPFALPAGVAPDSTDAVEWLLGSGHPQTWLVDGHNLAHRLDPSRFLDPDMRAELATHAGRLRRLALGPFRAVIVFDTRASVGDAVTVGPGVDLRFAQDADAELIDLARELGSGTVVISSDREVREASEGNGVIVLWSEALVEFIRA